LTKIRKAGFIGSVENYASETKQIAKTLIANYALVMLAAKAIFRIP
jgi:hypothetical protein